MLQSTILTVPKFLEMSKNAAQFHQLNKTHVLNFCLDLLSDRNPYKNEIGYINNNHLMGEFAFLLEKYDQIHTLNLSFNSINHLSFDQLEILINAIKKLKLKRLILDYNDLVELDEKARQLLIELIKSQAESLETLSLAGTQCGKMGTFWHEFASSLTLLKQLRELNLASNHFGEDPSILKSFKKLKACKNLISIYFDWNSLSPTQIDDIINSTNVCCVFKNKGHQLTQNQSIILNQRSLASLIQSEHNNDAQVSSAPFANTSTSFLPHQSITRISEGKRKIDKSSIANGTRSNMIGNRTRSKTRNRKRNTI